MLYFRPWQKECIELAYHKFQVPYSHFMCMATPGAGKTQMACSLSKIMLNEGRIDFVIAFSPSSIVAKDFQLELEKTTGRRFNGQIGANGLSVTYQSMATQSSWFWQLFEQHRVLVIFDEIHHCAGDSIMNANSWGEKIISYIQGKAIYSLALSGTPWHSDKTPISLTAYCDENNTLVVDYQFGLREAIDEEVCRCPHITALDNQKITVLDDNSRTSYRSFSHLLEENGCQYFDLLTHNAIIDALLTRSLKKLNNLRNKKSNAGGLIVGASVEHAKQIQQRLAKLGENSVLVSYQDEKAKNIINRFKSSKEKWIISVGMISEGTNIPRLRVCCFLSLVTTELYFRQVLGRILRFERKDDHLGYFYMLANPTLLRYAARVYEDIPEELSTVQLTKLYENTFNEQVDEVIQEQLPIEIEKPLPSGDVNTGLTLNISGEDGPFVSNNANTLEQWYNTTIGSLGKYKELVFSL